MGIHAHLSMMLAILPLTILKTVAELDKAAWEDATLSLLQVQSRWSGNKNIHSSSEINDGDGFSLTREEPMTWPEELQYPELDIPIPIRVFVWSLSGFIPETHTSKLGNCTVDTATSASFETHIPPSPEYDISNADVVIFGLPNMLWDFPNNYVLPRTKSANQMWVSMCEEPYKREGFQKADCRLMLDPDTMEFMDVASSYSMESDIPALLESVYVDDLRMAPPDFSNRPSDELATIAVSDCDSEWRNNWLKDMMAEVNKRGHKVLSYGSCLHNAEEPLNEEKPKITWKNRDASRPFKLVAENTLQPWYVTEKIWLALAEGAMPVYFGPPQVKQMLPPGSFLYAGDFPSTQSLVQRMLDFTPADFEKANAWRSKPTSSWGMWETTWMKGRHTIVNRLCEFAAKQKLAGKLFKSGETPAAHDLPCCLTDPSRTDPSCCLSPETSPSVP